MKRIIVQTALIAALVSTTINIHSWWGFNQPTDQERKEQLREKYVANYKKEVEEPALDYLKWDIKELIRKREFRMLEEKYGRKYDILYKEIKELKKLEENPYILIFSGPDIADKIETPNLKEDLTIINKDYFVSLDSLRDRLQSDLAKQSAQQPGLWQEIKNWWNRRSSRSSYGSNAFAPVVLVNQPTTVEDIMKQAALHRAWQYAKKVPASVMRTLEEAPQTSQGAAEFYHHGFND